MTSPLGTWLGGRSSWALIWGVFGLAFAAVVVIPIVSLKSQAEAASQTAKRAIVARAQALEARLTGSSDVSAALSAPETLLGTTGGLAPYVLPVRLPTNGVQLADLAVQDFASQGCEVTFPGHATACFAVGRDDSDVMQRIYVGVKFPAGRLRQHMHVQRVIAPPPFAVTDARRAHRLELTLHLGRQEHQWILPVQTNVRRGVPNWDQPLITAYRSLSDKRGWTGVYIKQQPCAIGDPDSCTRETYFSAVFPRVEWDKTFDPRKPVPSPIAANDARLHVRVLEPADNESPADRVLLDTRTAPGNPKVSLGDIERLLQPGEQLTVWRVATGGTPKIVFTVGQPTEVHNFEGVLQQIGHWALRVAAKLAKGASLSDEGQQGQASRRLDLDLRGSNLWVDFSTQPSRVIDSRLAAEAGAVVVLATTMLTALLVLAVVVGLLLRRVIADATREREREARERDRSLFELRREQERAAFDARLWRQIGHEIKSPLSGLKALLGGKATEVPYRTEFLEYTERMLRAVELFSASHGGAPIAALLRLDLEAKDLVPFLRDIASNATEIGVPNVEFVTTLDGLRVQADFAALADVFAKLLDNAHRYRRPDSNITITLTSEPWEAVVVVHNKGLAIPEERLDRIFDWGVSQHGESTGHLGLGLFMAALYLNKMNGSIRARNVEDGVEFELRLRRAE